MYELGSQWMDFCKISYWCLFIEACQSGWMLAKFFLLKSVDKLQIWLKLAKNIEDVSMLALLTVT
jgi:hypothetical protein